MQTKIDKFIRGKSGEIYRKLLEGMATNGEPHRFIDVAYKQYTSKNKNNPSVNGRIFEYLVCETLAQIGIKPFYHQARFTLVPNADFDVVCYDPIRPVVLSMKVSLRERYKQADLEGFALRQVYRNATSYLITLSREEKKVSEKIEAGDVTGIAACVRADLPEYSVLLSDLKENHKFSYATKIMPISGTSYPAQQEPDFRPNCPDNNQD